MEEAGVLDIEFGGFDDAFAEVFEPWGDLADHEGFGEDI